jgi:DNA-binding CsgD family transcriptional regulator
VRDNVSPSHWPEESMPLSEEEQRILSEIEAQLSVSDPALVQQVSETTVYRHSGRAIRWAGLGFVGGLAVMLLTFTKSWILGAVGFGLMLACAIIIVENIRKMGRAGLESLTGSVRPRALRDAFSDRAKWRGRFRRPDQP